ncbi:unnamed protein product [Ceutorhynchus assimilis]|uniref:Uncharacterized protein n=1 Tax=Ceutorhynchus assimilis TaxID=467358 RepID=A0A9N9ME70_9CUCU|nr:unnamed protein product [Ceutorhynchus assimilis]
MREKNGRFCLENIAEKLLDDNRSSNSSFLQKYQSFSIFFLENWLSKNCAIFSGERRK